MSQNQAKVEFDFDAQPASGELTIKSGEVVTVLKEVFWGFLSLWKGYLGLKGLRSLSLCSPENF